MRIFWVGVRNSVAELPLSLALDLGFDAAVVGIWRCLRFGGKGRWGTGDEVVSLVAGSKAVGLLTSWPVFFLFDAGESG